MTPRPKPREAGITLVEVMVAITILSIVLISLGGLMFHVARQTQLSAASTYRAAAVQRASAWIEGLPWDSLDGAVGPETALLSGPMTYDRSVTVSPLGAAPYTKTITVAIFPTGPLALIGSDTLVVVRSRERKIGFLQ